MPYTVNSQDIQSPSMPELVEFITTEEAAERLGFHVITIRRLVREEKLSGVKFGRTWLVSKQSIEEYLKETQGLTKHDPRRK